MERIPFSVVGEKARDHADLNKKNNTTEKIQQK